MTQPTPHQVTGSQEATDWYAQHGHVIVPIREYRQLTELAHAARSWRQMWNDQRPQPGGRVEELIAAVDALDAPEATDG